MVSIPSQILTLFQGTLKTKCGDSFKFLEIMSTWMRWHPPPKNSFLPVLRECFFQEKGICDSMFLFHKTVWPFGVFQKKEEEERDWLDTRQQEVSWFSRPAWTSSHQHISWEFCPLDGVEFLIQWLTVRWPFCADLFFRFCLFLLQVVFFLNFEITRPATYYLPSWPYLLTKNQLPPLPLSPTYLLDPHPLFPPKLVTLFLHTQHLHNINGNHWK